MQNSGILYLVATPIGNLEDITLRAITVLKSVQFVAAEDTRQSTKLLKHYGINAPLLSLHAHNEKSRSKKVVELLSQGSSVAYVTDAGTPAISDPGALLVHLVREQGFTIIPIPGACAAVAALSVSGFTQGHFYFEGFLPHSKSDRKQRLQNLKFLASPLIFYESSHRIMAMLADVQEILGHRNGIIARELTKRFETIYSGNIMELIASLNCNATDQLGEFVVIVAGNEVEPEAVNEQEILATLGILLKKLPLKDAVGVTSELLNIGKNHVYKLALKIKDLL